jgi:phage terminase large subunit
MSQPQQIIVPYAPRDAFLPYHRATHRYCLTVAHRRAGKTVARINKLVRAAASCRTEAPRFGYLAPFFVQAKEIAWGYLKHYAAPILAVGGKINESELSIHFAHNGATVRLYGAENAERMRGLYFDGLVADEAQDIAPHVLTQIILPALADRGGWLDMSGTPKGWSNLLGVTYKRAITDPNWYVQVLKASQTGILPAAELESLRAAMPSNEYDQELECSFDAAITGAYYADELTIAEEDGRITAVPYDRALLVNTAWDLGISDSMTIWFFQQVGREVRFIDYYEASGFGLDHYAGKLKDKPYLYGTHYAPHDIAVRELGTGKSRLETAEALGIAFQLVPNIGIKDGIDAARMLLGRAWFDATKCAIGLDALRQYREKIDEKRGIHMGPLHDWTSHAADSFRYACVAMEEHQIAARKEEEDRGWSVGWMG